MSRSYTLSQNQLMVLLRGRGYHTATGVLSSRKMLDDETVLNVLNGLVADGLLTAGESSFEMDPGLRSVIDRVAEAKEFFAISSRDPDLPDKCLFTDCSNDRMLLCTLRGETGPVTFSEVSFEELTDTLFDEGYLLSKECALLPVQDEAAFFEEKAFGGLSKFDSLKTDSYVLLNIELIGDEPAKERSLRIMDYSLCYYVVYFYKGNIARTSYNRENIEKLMKKMMNNDLC